MKENVVRLRDNPRTRLWLTAGCLLAAIIGNNYNIAAFTLSAKAA